MEACRGTDDIEHAIVGVLNRVGSLKTVAMAAHSQKMRPLDGASAPAGETTVSKLDVV